MPQFVNPSKTFPICDAVIYGPRVLETVITGIPDGADAPVSGGPAAEMREIFRQLDEILAARKLPKKNVVSVRLFLQNVNADIGAVNEVYRAYFEGCSPMRIAVGSDLQAGMRVEAVFVVEMP